MLMIIYLLGALTTGTLLLVAFLIDETTPIASLSSWIVLSIAALIWPLALPMSCIELWRNRHRAEPIMEFEQIKVEASG